MESRVQRKGTACHRRRDTVSSTKGGKMKMSAIYEGRKMQEISLPAVFSMNYEGH